jgi:hypothetical protein
MVAFNKWLLANLLVVSVRLVTGRSASNTTFDVLDYVDQLIGSSNGGMSSIVWLSLISLY